MLIGLSISFEVAGYFPKVGGSSPQLLMDIKKQYFREITAGGEGGLASHPLDPLQGLPNPSRKMSGASVPLFLRLLLGNSLQLQNLLKALTKISYIGTLYKVRYKQD
jgi:hypothetical protein